MSNIANIRCVAGRVNTRPTYEGSNQTVHSFEVRSSSRFGTFAGSVSHVIIRESASESDVEAVKRLLAAMNV